MLAPVRSEVHSRRTVRPLRYPIKQQTQEHDHQHHGGQSRNDGEEHKAPQGGSLPEAPAQLVPLCLLAATALLGQPLLERGSALLGEFQAGAQLVVLDVPDASVVANARVEDGGVSEEIAGKLPFES